MGIPNWVNVLDVLLARNSWGNTLYQVADPAQVTPSDRWNLTSNHDHADLEMSTPPRFLHFRTLWQLSETWTYLDAAVGLT